MEKSEAVVIVGTGAVALALGKRLHERDLPLILASRQPGYRKDVAGFIGATTPVVSYREAVCLSSRFLLAVPDDAVGDVAAELRQIGLCNSLVLHTCGVHGSEALGALASAGCALGSLHPMQTIPSAEKGYLSLPGSPFALEGDAEAVEWAKDLVSLIEGRPFALTRGAKPLYHAAAVFAGNYVTVLMGMASDLLAEAGLTTREASEVLAPLAQESLKNALECDPSHVLTGPIRRGDVETVKKHLEALDRKPGSRRVYEACGLQALRMCSAGLPAPIVSDLGKILVERGSHEETD